MPEYTLSGCIDDICNIRNILIDAYSYDKTNIIMLRDDLSDTYKMPTYANILRELNDIVTSNSDEIFIQYSGHGCQIADISNNSINNDVIVPIDYNDTNYIYDYDIHTMIEKIQCAALFMFDCCHSGSIGKLPWTFIMNTDNQNIITINNNNSMPNPNIYLLSGCKDNQTSSDVYNREISQDVGVFSNTFNECLRDSNHEIDILTLYKNICSSLLVNGYSQRPVLSSTSKTPDYIFSKSEGCLINIKKPVNSMLFRNHSIIPINKNTMHSRMNSIIKNI